ncbi:MAG: hypothetical protein M3Y32_06450, partial [Pseudomonadota bacterium]|nr:hypothetical protein [Pseudomonadota bacterium]
ALLGATSAALAEPTTIELAPVPAASAAAPAASAASAPETALKRNVIEDDNVRIEETRLRGLPTRITVRNKSTGGSSYEILTGPNGKDPSQDKGAAGQRAWSLFDF